MQTVVSLVISSNLAKGATFCPTDIAMFSYSGRYSCAVSFLTSYFRMSADHIFTLIRGAHHFGHQPLVPYDS